MASINKLSIRGIRAFSPDDQEQVVEFFFPLTVIHGSNGCGKTTIIEALKYALSGSLPPGGASRSAGQCFVHDPRVIDQSVVKANVKLRFTNKAGCSMVVIRSMEVTKKKTTMAFKQLDGVIRTMDPTTGERVTLSHKCSELDKQIPQLMGVSKAILDYVLFVHQEDSSWPLQEAAILKKRFDDIFDSTMYSKALESFRKTKKELTSQVKDIKAEVNTYKSHRFAAQEFRKELTQQNEGLENLEDQIKESRDAVDASRTEHAKWVIVAAEVDNLEECIRKQEAELANLRSVVSKQRSMLEKDLTNEHDLAKLNEMLRDFDKEMSKQKEREEELSRECRTINRDIEELRQKEMKLNSSKGKHAAEKEAQEQRLRERLLVMEKIATTYTLELQQSLTQLTQLSRMDTSILAASQNSSVLTDGGAASTQETGGAPMITLSKEDMMGFFRTLTKKETELKENLRSHKAKARAQEDEYNGSLQELVGNKNAFENERKKLNDENKAIGQEMRDLSQELGSNKIKKSTIDDLRDRAKEHAKELENLNNNDQRETLGAAIRSHNERINVIDEDIESKMNMRKRYQRSATMQNKLNLLKENRAKDASKLKDMLESKTATLNSFDIDVPNDLDDEANIAPFVRETQNTISNKYIDAVGKVTEAQEAEAKTRQAISQEQGTNSSLIQSRNDLRQRKNVLCQAENSVGKIKALIPVLVDHGFKIEDFVIEKDDPQMLLDTLDGHLKRLDDSSPEQLPPESVAKLMRKIKKLGKKRQQDTDKRECPCCRRDLTDVNDYQVFLESLAELANPDSSPLLKAGKDEEIETYRSDVARTKDWRETVYKCMNDLLDYRRIVAELDGIAPKLQAGEAFLNDKKKELALHQKAVAERESEASTLRELQNACKSWGSEAGRIDEQTQNISDISEQLEIETADAVGGSLEEVEEDIQKLRDEKDDLFARITKGNKKITAINSEISAASSKASKTQENLRLKEEKFEKEKRASERKQQLEVRKNAIVGEVTKLGERITSLTQKINAKEAEKGRLYAHSNDEEVKLNEAINTFVTDVKHLRDLSDRIEEFADRDDGESLDRISADVEKIIAKIKAKKKELNALMPDVEKAKKAVSDQERHRKLLNDNCDLIVSENRIEEVNEKLLKHEEDRKNVEGADIMEGKLQELELFIQKHEASIARLEGRRSEMIDQIRGLNRKLGAEEYKNVDEQYRSERIKMETTNLAIEDIGKYAAALDKALLEFHQVKIKEINKIIRELWVKTYKGEDIKSIRLDSGQDTRASKSYNYRVVMKKGDAEMDMRGRCSAGQRVLASLVIRLALAETFGVSCGCLVLDEPSVNLDENNKRGLAIAMAQIIADRSKQNNFQLVLITHDDTFISMMKDELSSQTGFSMPENYFHVRREQASDHKFYSKIDRCDWDDVM